MLALSNFQDRVDGTCCSVVHQPKDPDDGKLTRHASFSPYLERMPLQARVKLQ